MESKLRKKFMGDNMDIYYSNDGRYWAGNGTELDPIEAKKAVERSGNQGFVDEAKSMGATNTEAESLRMDFQDLLNKFNANYAGTKDIMESIYKKLECIVQRENDEKSERR